jgi:CubicO group peptidase (beta-lactamase class C family)
MTESPRIKALDKICSQFGAKTPGAALVVEREGKLVHAAGYGMADLANAIPNTPTTVFGLASVTKQFTAFCIFLLESRGKLKLSDDIRKYVSEIPKYGRPIQVQHLIHHTSGIRDYLELFYLAGAGTDYREPRILKMLAAQKELNFEPGAEHLYSNSGYSLLATIIHRVSGMTLEDFARREIFLPLGMTQTCICENLPRKTPQAAYGYSYRKASKSWKRIKIGGVYQAVGDGNGFASALDLLIWNRNLDSGKVGGGQVRDRMHRRGLLNSGKRTDYAGGIHHRKLDGVEVVEHGGSDPGFECELMRVPSLGLSFALLGNSDGKFNLGEVARQVLKHFAKPGTSKPKSAAVKPVEAFLMDAAALKKYEGSFEGSQLNFRVSAVKGGLSADCGGWSIGMHPIGPDLFQGKEGWSACRFRFDFSRGGELTGYSECWQGIPEIRYRYQPKGEVPTDAEVLALQGPYRSNELSADYVVKTQRNRGTARLKCYLKQKPKRYFSAEVWKLKEGYLLDKVKWPASGEMEGPPMKLHKVGAGSDKARSLAIHLNGRVRRLVLNRVRS